MAIGCGGSAEAPSTGEIRWKLGDSRTADSLRIVGGSARQLEDGGWLVSWGDNPLVTAFDPSQRIAFRLRLPASTFRAVPVPAGAITVAELDRGLERMEQRR